MTIIQGEEVAMAAIVLGTGMVTVLTLARLWFRRLELRDQNRALTSSVEERLLRIEEAVDAMAVEMERMSESQRFTSKVLAERLPSALPGSTTRSNT